MKIQRVDNNCITCHISKEELASRGMAPEDLMSDKEKARDLLADVLNAARETVNFTSDSGALNVQLAATQEGDVSMTIFDDERNNLLGMLLRGYKEILEAKQRELQARQNQGGLLGSPMALTPEKTRELLDKAGKDEIVDLPVEASFTSMDDVLTVARKLYIWNGDMPSTLVKYEDEYCLSLTIRDRQTQLARSIMLICEYCDAVEQSMGAKLRVQEHGRVLVQDHAVQKLAGL